VVRQREKNFRAVMQRGGDKQTAVEMWVVFTIAREIVHKVKIKIKNVKN